MYLIGAALGALLVGAWIAARCFFRVEQGWVAALTSFGAVRTQPGDSKKVLTFGPGLHVKRPWDHVHKVCIMEQNLELSGEQGGQTAMAEDGTVIRFDSILRYVPLEKDLEKFLFRVKSPLEHVTGLFTCLLRNEIANFKAHAGVTPAEGGSYGLIRRERKELNKRLDTLCLERINDRYGVEFRGLDLVDILPPDELSEPLNAVMNARTEADALLARMDAECQRRVVAAERGVAIAQARASAVETEIGVLAGYLEKLDKDGTLDDYVARRRAEVLSQSRALFRRSA